MKEIEADREIESRIFVMKQFEIKEIDRIAKSN